MRRISLSVAVLIAIRAGAGAASGQADGQRRQGSLVASAAWARATPRNAPVGGAYLTLSNHGATSDRLIAVATSASGKTEIHQMRMEGNVMVMRAMPDGIEIGPHQTVTLSPGGNHLMLMGLMTPLMEGGKLNATLTFQSGAKIELEVPVLGMGAKGPPMTADDMNGMLDDHDHHH